MKYSAALSLGLVQLALAKSIHKVAPIRREPQFGATINGVQASAIELAELRSKFGLVPGSINSGVNVLWIHVGGAAATTVINQAQTVTVTVNGAANTIGAGIPPIGNVPGQVAASPTQVAGVSPILGAGGATHTITVGGPGRLIFDPPQLSPAVGDTLIFNFLSQNHTVTQSAFETPCDPLAGGMDSGYQANPDNTVNPPPQIAMQVMVDTPLWFFCRQANHCGKGMVFSVNPSREKTASMFQSLAIQQRGGLPGSAIVGGAPAPPVAAPAAPGAVPPAGAPVGGVPAAVTPPDNALASGVVTGQGTVNADGTCNCIVSCDFNSAAFPAPGQGAGAFGGIPGGVDMGAIPVRR